jgi:UDP-N-acetylmuramoyl-L-alanyl-D-glutamate--2,6-diaminopimelate ligase
MEPVRLETILDELENPGIDGDVGVEVSAITRDSRLVEPGGLFIAVQGFELDGNRYAADAVRRGAVAVLSAAERQPGTDGAAWIRVEDDRLAMARAAAAYYRHPDRELLAVGITGTNGKTTTAFLLESILCHAGRRAGLVGTVCSRWPGHEEEAARTTPESVDLYRLLREMVTARCSDAVLEISSHALALHRVEAVRLQAGIFTNLSRDHMDFHRDMESYFEVKASMFEGLGPDAVAILNADDARFEDLRRRTRAEVLSFGASEDADVRAEGAEFLSTGTRAQLLGPWGELPVACHLPGQRNLENVMAAATAALALAVEPAAIAAGVGALKAVPGRFEPVRYGQPFEVIVDFAHTDDALRKLLAAVRSLEPARIVTVFGCGGSRDKTKRPLMGEAAAAGSDVVILSSDNPRAEDPEAIADDAQVGVERACRLSKRPIQFHRILDRREAIRFAIAQAQPGDAVVIAGKGHENFQIIGNRRLPFDDRDECRAALEERFPGGDRA